MSHAGPEEGSAELAIGAGATGQRLDRALAPLMPDEGLRGRRRRIARGGVLVNGGMCTEPARRLRAGDVLALASSRPRAETAGAGARLLARQEDFCFLFKPSGLHSAALAGEDGESLEESLPALCALVLGPGERPMLLQRLDHGTSGIVCAALAPHAARDFRAAEAAGTCEKRYLALLTGELDAPVTARARLDTKNRRTTRLLDEEALPLRRTEFLPLHTWQGEDAARLLAGLCAAGALSGAAQAPRALTLAACRIRRGARHQIRAHAAGLGHPLLGDARYAPAGTPVPADGRFFLHHGFLAWPGHRCSVPAPWPWLEQMLPGAARRAVRAWLGPQAATESTA